MPKKGERIIAPRIMRILEENKKPMRFSEIFKALAEHGWFTTQRPISDNLKYLISEGKIVKVDRYYGIPSVRDDGSKFIIIKNVFDENETVEIE